MFSFSGTPANLQRVAADSRIHDSPTFSQLLQDLAFDPLHDAGATTPDAERAPAPAQPAANDAPAQAPAVPAAGGATAVSDAERAPAPAQPDANAAPAQASAVPAAGGVTAASDAERAPAPRSSGGGGSAPIPDYNCALVAELILFCAVARFVQKHIMLDLLAETLNRWIIDRRRSKERIRRRKRKSNS